VTAKPSNSSSSSSIATYDVICKRRNATTNSEPLHSETKSALIASAHTYLNEATAEIHELERTKLTNGTYPPEIAPIIMAAMEVQKLANAMIHAKNNTSIKPEKFAILEQAVQTFKGEKRVKAEHADAAPMNTKHATAQDALVLAKNVSISIQDYKYPNKNFQENLTLLRQIVASVQGLADTILNSSNTSNTPMNISKLNTARERLIALHDIVKGQASTLTGVNAKSVGSIVVDKVPANFMTMPVANASVADAAAPAMPAAAAASAASANAGLAASANAPVAASAASAAAANAHSTTAMPVASASPAALVNASHASIPGSFPIVKPTSLAKAVSAPTPSSTHPPSMPRPPAAINTISSQGGRRTKRKQTNRKQTKRTRKQTKRNRKQTKCKRNRNRKQTKRNRKRTHRKNK